jgi:hypothetical protein
VTALRNLPDIRRIEQGVSSDGLEGVQGRDLNLDLLVAGGEDLLLLE